jgi:glucose-1-phosphate thymidylyltransferase
MHEIPSNQPFRRRGIILAGGAGTRLHPLTLPISKQLMAVYDKPMIYYPLSVLMLAGIREILVITTAEDQQAFQRLLGDGGQWGTEICYAIQHRPEGLAQAYHIGADFVRGQPSALILGDNLFHGHGLPQLLDAANQRQSGATVFGYYVANPESYGVITFDENGRAVAIDEKPAKPKSNHAVTGLYFYDGEASDIAASLRPSARGEYEITDLNRAYLERGALHVELMGRGFAWLDTGTHRSLLDAATYVRIIEERQGLKICCPEEIAWRQGFISDSGLESLAQPLLKSGYGTYLMNQLRAGRNAVPASDPIR